MAKQKNLKGLSRDNAPLEQPDGTYPFGKNGVQYDTKGLIKNEPGFIIETAAIPGEVIGVIETEGDAIIFSVATNGVSSIGLYSPVTRKYTLAKDDSAFPATDKWNFDRKYYITGEYQRNALGERIVAWTDKSMPPRMLNLDNNAGVVAAKDTLLFLQALTPTIDVEADSGGILEKGAYFVAAKLLKNDGSETGYLAISKPEIISAPTTTGTITDQALNITVSNIDQSFDRIQLAIVRRKDGIYTVQVMSPMEIIPGKVTAIYTGENLTEVGTIDEILVNNAVYSRVGTMGQLNDALYIADLEKEPELDMQQYANLIKVRVKSELIDVIPQTPEHVSGKKPSLMHQEVYALYVRYHKTVGSWTSAFHIPGNTPLSADLLAAAGVHEGALSAKVFQVQDTNRNINTANQSCDTGIWVNDTEFYPDLPSFDSSSIGGPNLRGQKVRHHRMPSLAFCKDNFYPGSGPINAEYGKTKLDILGLEVSNVIIPANLQGVIDGYEIMIAKRTLANSTVLGQSLLLYSAQPNDVFGTNLKIMSTGGNWGSITTENKNLSTPASMGQSFSVKLTGFKQSEQGPTNTPTPVRGARIRLHSFDMLFNKPAIKPAYIAPQWKLRVDNLDKDFPNGGYIEDDEINDAGAPVVHIIDYTKGTIPATVDSTHKVRVIEDGQYLPNNVNTGEYENTHLETTWATKLKWIGSDADVTNNGLPIAFDYPTVNLRQFQRAAQKLHWEETYLVNLMDVKADLYNNFYSQPLVASGQFVPATSSFASINVGDTYLNDYSYHTYGWTNGRDDKTGGPDADENWQAGYKIVRRFVCEAVSNINLRYEITGNQYSKWWPHNSLVAQPSLVDTNYITLFDRRMDPNQFGYSKDLNTLNDFGNYTPANPYADNITKFPFRIHRLGKMPRQGKTRSWRTALPLDYYEAQKNRGRITKLLGKEDKLIIHHENAIFQTQDKAKLDGGVLSVTLGTGDIFQFEPQETQSSKQGYAGLQHELAGIDTPWGYVFVDVHAGQIFMKNQEGLKLMNQGLNQFFRQYLRDIDKNPFIGNGITLGYDPVYKRIMLSVKNTVISTSPENFVPGYEETTAFFSTLTPGVSVVKNHGRYLLFLGPNTTSYSCSTNLPPYGIDDVVSIPENTANGTVVRDIHANYTDPEGKPLTFAIMGGNPGGAFTINPATGVVRVANSTMLDYETRTSFALVIRATDDKGLYVDHVLTVNLTNVVEPPVLHDYQVTVPETTPSGTNLVQIIGSDPEGGSLSYSILTPSVPFAINSTTGMITLSGTLDYELIAAYDLSVQATSSVSGLTAEGTVRVLVTNVNEPPVGTDATVTLYKDLAKAGDVVSTMTASDPDGDSTTVAWTNAVALGSKFSFDPSTFQVRLIDPSLVSAGEKYVLVFDVTDPSGLDDTFTLTINIAVSALLFSGGDYTCIGASCGAGDTLTPDGSACYHYSDTAATPPSGGTPITTVARHSGSYGWAGTRIFAPGFNVNGTGPFGVLDLSNDFWRNIPSDSTHGPLNRCGLWGDDGNSADSTDNPLNTPIGFTVQVNIPASKQYYIGVAGDNTCQIKVTNSAGNTTTVVSQDAAALQSYMNANDTYYNSYTSQVTFNAWYVYPVQLTSGPNIIEITAINTGVIGAFGAEIYDATYAELEAAASYTDLGAKLIFSTKDYIGQNLQLGGSVAWSCPAGYSLVDLGGGSYVCRQIVTTAPGAGHTKHWTTVKVKNSAGDVLATLVNQPGQTYMGQAVDYLPDEPNSTDCGYVYP